MQPGDEDEAVEPVQPYIDTLARIGAQVQDDILRTLADLSPLQLDGIERAFHPHALPPERLTIAAFVRAACTHMRNHHS